MPSDSRLALELFMYFTLPSESATTLTVVPADDHPLPPTSPAPVAESLIDLSLAAAFLTRLDEEADSFTFQTFADRAELKVTKADGRKWDPLARVLHGTLEQHADTLRRVNDQGAGIFVTVNATNGQGRALANILRVRALFADFDKADAVAAAERDRRRLEPHLVIESSPGKRHLYWFVDTLALNQFKPWQQHLAAECGSDPSVNDLPRVMRLPGFAHRKGAPFQVRILADSPHRLYTETDFVAAFGAPGVAAVSKPPLKVPAVAIPAPVLATSAPAPSPEQAAIPDVRPGKISAGGRHDFLVKLCAHWHRQGMAREAIVTAALAADAQACDPPKGDGAEILAIVDWLDANAGRQQGQQIHGATPPAPHAWPEARPLVPATPPAAPYPLTALGGSAAALAGKMQQIIQAPDGLIGQVLLCAMNLAAHGHGNLRFDGMLTPASLFLITVGVSGERKSSCEAVAMAPIRQVESELLATYYPALREYQLVKLVLDQEIDSIKKDKKLHWRERLQKIQALGELFKPRAPYFEVSDPTLEGLHKQLVEEHPAAALINDDAGQVLAGHSMAADQRMKTLPAWTKLWDRGNFDRMRAGSPSGKYFHRRFALHLMLQPLVAQNILGDPLAQKQGFLARCLLAFPESTIGLRAYKNEDLLASAEYQAYAQDLDSLLRTPLDINTAGEIQFRELAFSPEAARHWIAFHDDVERQLGTRGAYAAIQAFGARAAENLKRLALTFSLAEQVDAAEVKLEHLERGMACMRYYLGETLRTQQLAQEDLPLAQARELLDWLVNNGQAGSTVKVKVIQQNGPTGFRANADELRRVLRTLCDHGYAHELDLHTYAIRPDGGAHGAAGQSQQSQVAGSSQ
jgi:hypothetical protein